MPEQDIKLARDFLKKKKVDTFLDKVFVKYIVKEIQKLSPDVGAILYPEQKMVVFFWKRIIFYKVILTEENVDKKTIEEHVKKAGTTLRALKLNLIPIRELTGIKSRASKIDFNIGKKLT